MISMSVLLGYQTLQGGILVSQLGLAAKALKLFPYNRVLPTMRYPRNEDFCFKREASLLLHQSAVNLARNQSAQFVPKRNSLTTKSAGFTRSSSVYLREVLTNFTPFLFVRDNFIIA